MQSTEFGFEITLSAPYESALEQVAAALKREGFGILTRIDVQATLKEKLNAEFRPYSILGACNPPLAHKALSTRADIGLMLPCNIIVEAAENGGSLVRIADPVTMLTFGNLGSEPVLVEVAELAHEKLLRAAESLAAHG